MSDKPAMRFLLESMERAAEDSLLHDSAFFEAMHALKWEIDQDPRVQSAAQDLRAAGFPVFHSFLPRVKVRIRTEQGIFALPKRSRVVPLEATHRAGGLIQELNRAASAVIIASSRRRELDVIVNEAVGMSACFEQIASEVERAGHQVLLCIDLSAYAQIQRSTREQREQVGAGYAAQESEKSNHKLFSDGDLKFLRALRISGDESGHIDYV